MKTPTTAQRLLMALGVDPQTVLLGHRVGKSYSYTKRGPGRKPGHGKGVQA